MKNRIILVSLVMVFVLPILACGGTATPTVPPQPRSSNTPEPPPPATSTNTPVPPPPATPTNTPVPFVGGDCDPSTDRIEMNSIFSKNVDGGSYPDACEVFCLWVPDGSRLEIGIADFNVDLDMYVDTDLSVLQYEDHGRWESNDYGTGDESVRITNPGGRYYIQVCSYEGLASSFIIHSTLTP